MLSLLSTFEVIKIFSDKKMNCSLYTAEIISCRDILFNKDLSIVTVVKIILVNKCFFVFDHGNVELKLFFEIPVSFYGVLR